MSGYSRPIALQCPYLVTVTNRDGQLVHEYCLPTHEACLIDESALSRLNCTRRAWLNTREGAESPPTGR